MSARTKILALAVLAAASPLAAQDAYRYGYIRTAEQGVTLQRASEAAAEIAAPNLPFLPGDRVWTDDAGRMDVQFADGSSLRLDSRSKLDYVAHEGGRRAERVVLRLWSGALILHVRDPRRSPDFVVETPEGTVEPDERGIYRIDVSPGEARIVVFEGEATVDAGRRARVEGGELVLVREGEIDGSPQRIGYEADDAFARWDRDIEEQLAYADARREEWLPEEVSPYAGDFAAYGSWHSEPEYGNVWYPRVDIGWQPYSRGYWAWTVYGWTWVPNERWGWATSHYGRWGHSNRGWYWIPGRSWGPGWVSWSVGNGHVGWCPLGLGDRPVFVRKGTFRGNAVRKASARAETLSYPWTYVRRTDMGQRDLARRRVDSAQVPTAELRVAPVGHSRLSRDLRLLDGAAGVGTGQPVAGGAVPRNVRLKPTIGDTVPELRTDPTTTIRHPIPRRHREPEEAQQPAGEPEGQPSSRVAVPRSPRSAPWVPAATAPRQERTAEPEGQVTSGQSGEREGERNDDRNRVLRYRPRPAEDEGARGRGDRDRETLRPIFGPLSRPRSDEGGAAEDRGGKRRDKGSSGDGGGSRPAGVSSAPRQQAPPPARPAEGRAQPRERAKPKSRD